MYEVSHCSGLSRQNGRVSLGSRIFTKAAESRGFSGLVDLLNRNEPLLIHPSSPFVESQEIPGKALCGVHPTAVTRILYESELLLAQPEGMSEALFDWSQALERIDRLPSLVIKHLAGEAKLLAKQQ